MRVRAGGGKSCTEQAYTRAKQRQKRTYRVLATDTDAHEEAPEGDLLVHGERVVLEGAGRHDRAEDHEGGGSQENLRKGGKGEEGGFECTFRL